MLNEVLTSELTAVNQYFLDAMMFDHWGYERLAKRFRDESIGEMNDAEKLIRRILYLEGHPNLQRLGPSAPARPRLRSSTLLSSSNARRSCRLNHGIALCTQQATTAAGTCSRTSSREKRATPTGSRANSRPSGRSVRRPTWPNSSTTDRRIAAGSAPAPSGSIRSGPSGRRHRVRPPSARVPSGPTSIRPGCHRVRPPSAPGSDAPSAVRASRRSGIRLTSYL